MNQGEIIQLLSSISIGSVIGWFAVVIAIVSAIGTAFIKMYKMFEKTHKIKEENDDYRKLVKDHEEKLNIISEQLEKIQNTLAQQDESTKKSMRHSIVRSCEEALVRGTITIREYKSLYEMYEEYHDKLHGNGYVTSLFKKLDNIQIVGKLNDNGDDVE